MASLLSIVVLGCDGATSDQSGIGDVSNSGELTSVTDGAISDQSGVGDVSSSGALTSVADLGVVMQIQSTGFVRVVDTATGAITAPDHPCCVLFPQPGTGDTVLASSTNGVSSNVRILDRELQERGSLILGANIDFGLSFLSPDGDLLLDRASGGLTDPVRVWTLDGQLVEQFDYPLTFRTPEAGWVHANRIVLRQQDHRGFLVGPSGGIGTDFATLGLPSSTNGSIHDFDGSPTAERIAFVVREINGQGSTVNTVRVVDLTTNAVHTVLSTPAYPDYTGAHVIHGVFWHHEGRGLFVLVGSSSAAGALPDPATLEAIGYEPSPTRLYFVESADAEGLTIDNANPANSSDGVVVIPRESSSFDDRRWPELRTDYFSLPRR